MESQRKAILINPDFKEAWANMGQAAKELGDAESAEKYYRKALEIDPKNSQIFHLLGTLYFGCGRHKESIKELDSSLSFDPDFADCQQLRGVVFHGLGQFSKAMIDYKKLFSKKPDHISFYYYEIAAWVTDHLDDDVRQISIDRELDPYFKEYFCKRHSPQLLINYSMYQPRNLDVTDCLLNPEPPEPLRRHRYLSFFLRGQEMIGLTLDSVGSYTVSLPGTIVKESGRFGRLLQLNSAGYLRNLRQHRMCGLAALQAGQVLNRIWRKGENIQVCSLDLSPFQLNDRMILTPD